jgi:muramoyltetrapeptide carboxypeptidase
MAAPVFPPALQPGDTIGVMAPSSYIAPEDIEGATRIIESAGYNVFVHPQTYMKFHQSAGTHEQKVAAIHDLATNNSIKAVFFAAGGNRTLHILDLIDFEIIKNNPKIYMGYSDGTALLNAIAARTNIVTWHGPTFRKFHTGHIEQSFNLKLLAGQENKISLQGSQHIIAGQATGRMYGGTLNVFRRLIGSQDMPDTHNAILFFEDCNEETSRIDAELCFLKRCGILKNAAALIFGEFKNLLDTGRPFGFTLEDIIREHTAGLNIPVLMNAPFGHGDHLPAFPIGARVSLSGTTLTILDLPA